MKMLQVAGVLTMAMLTCTAGAVFAQEEGVRSRDVASDSQAALQKLTSTVPLAAELTKTAVAILVFPTITKAGLGIGGQLGEGALLKKRTAVAYYKTTGASFGLQAGGQKYRLRDVLHQRERSSSSSTTRTVSRSASVPASSSSTKAWGRARRPRPSKTTSTPSSSARKASWPASVFRVTKLKRSRRNRSEGPPPLWSPRPRHFGCPPKGERRGDLLRRPSFAPSLNRQQNRAGLPSARPACGLQPEPAHQ